MKRKGIRFIDGQEYLLFSRLISTKADADALASSIRNRFDKVKVIKVGFMDYGVYVHGIHHTETQWAEARRDHLLGLTQMKPQHEEGNR